MCQSPMLVLVSGVAWPGQRMQMAPCKEKIGQPLLSPTSGTRISFPFNKGAARIFSASAQALHATVTDLCTSRAIQEMWYFPHLPKRNLTMKQAKQSCPVQSHRHWVLREGKFPGVVPNAQYKDFTDRLLVSRDRGRGPRP